MDSLRVATLTYIRKKMTLSAIQRVDLSLGGGEGCVSSPQRGVCRCVYCCDGVEGGEEEEVFGEGLLAKEEESDRCSSSSFFKYSSLRANNSL